MTLIIGLGNPGNKYARTRHNVGFMAVSFIAKQKGVAYWRNEHKGLVATYMEAGEKVMLVKPKTYMNLSGLCVAELAAYYKVPLDHVIVIYDDIDLPLGQLRIRKKGGPGTHNGMRSIVDSLGSGEFPRFRLGIGPKDTQRDLATFVLSKFDAEEQAKVDVLCARVAAAATVAVQENLDKAMNRFNG